MCVCVCVCVCACVGVCIYILYIYNVCVCVCLCVCMCVVVVVVVASLYSLGSRDQNNFSNSFKHLPSEQFDRWLVLRRDRYTKWPVSQEPEPPYFCSNRKVPRKSKCFFFSFFFFSFFFFFFWSGKSRNVLNDSPTSPLIKESGW